MYHLFNEDQDDWECRNVVADAYLNWTGYDDCCEDFVPREPKKKKLSDRIASELDRRSALSKIMAADVTPFEKV